MIYKLKPLTYIFRKSMYWSEIMSLKYTRSTQIKQNKNISLNQFRFSNWPFKLLLFLLSCTYVSRWPYSASHLCFCCFSGEGQHRQMHLRPECSGQGRSGQSYSLNYPVFSEGFSNPQLLVPRRDVHFSLRNKLISHKIVSVNSVGVYSIYTSADGKINGSLIQLQLVSLYLSTSAYFQLSMNNLVKLCLSNFPVT